MLSSFTGSQRTFLTSSLWYWMGATNRPIHFLGSRHVVSLSIPTGTNECVSAPLLAPRCIRFLHLYPPVRSAFVCLHQVQRSLSRRHLRCHLLQVRVCSTRYWLTYSLMILPCVFLAGSSTSSVYGPKKRKAFPIGALLGFEPSTCRACVVCS